MRIIPALALTAAALSAAAPPAAAETSGNLVRNQSFETRDLSGWRVDLVDSDARVDCGRSYLAPSHGDCFAVLPGAGDAIFQTVEIAFAEFQQSQLWYELSFDRATFARWEEDAVLELSIRSLRGFRVVRNTELHYLPSSLERFNVGWLGPNADHVISFTNAGAVGSIFLDNIRVVASTSMPPTSSPPTSAVPEPTAWALMIAGFGLVGHAARRQRGSAAPSATA